MYLEVYIGQKKSTSKFGNSTQVLARQYQKIVCFPLPMILDTLHAYLWYSKGRRACTFFLAYMDFQLYVVCIMLTWLFPPHYEVPT